MFFLMCFGGLSGKFAGLGVTCWFVSDQRRGGRAAALGMGPQFQGAPPWGSKIQAIVRSTRAIRRTGIRLKLIEDLRMDVELCRMGSPWFDAGGRDCDFGN